ncbi:oxalurate catabolism protein HpxZ [Pseudomonas sp. 7P_10.2_Bac1]|uniref:oxalurate catabolism protein HpxZ n=1 Tax=Pseudomonas sp. 7P_10.2_Bac1 TaxID=2971614 RepID=UPI0021C5D590|nr:oxalurate catabolism protein HpxZ [Pseudomonas sp. 7P_10.2_Bac1]MCU1727737.1 oxalurate catabolism protein HpxZ [Pseudomonas sp. 7P_10.2_Bac1]
MEKLTIGTFVVDEPQVLSEVTAQCDRYETALMDNDLDTLDGLFCDSPVTLRYGVGENLYGIEAIRGFRKGRSGGSPKRVVTRREITCFGDSVALCNLEFKRENAAVVGRQSQTWLRTDAGWRIVSAHVSLMAATS